MMKNNTTTNHVITKNDLLMESVSKFFSNHDNIRKLLSILQGKSGISLRVLDWFATNYCKKKNITIEVPSENGGTKNFIVYLDYKSQLKSYSKKQFDPFCRRDRIEFVYGEGTGQKVITTCGQLNFFRWLISNRILDYVEENLEDIENDMNSSMRKTNTTCTWKQYSTLETKNAPSFYEPHESVNETFHEEAHFKIVPEQNYTTDTASMSEQSNETSYPIYGMNIGMTPVKPNGIITNDINVGTSRKKRQELSINATKVVNRQNVCITVDFE